MPGCRKKLKGIHKLPSTPQKATIGESSSEDIGSRFDMERQSIQSSQDKLKQYCG